MKITNFSKTLTSNGLNNTLKEKFGYRLNLDELRLDKAQKMLVSVNENIDKALQKGGQKVRNSKLYAEQKLISETLTKFVSEKRNKMMVEQRRSKLRRKLNEAEAQEAEVLLASKDMVDRIQKMIEDLGAMQNEQIQPLVDSIRQTMGDETATSFEGAMSGAINTAMEAVRAARGEADSASRILSGEAPADADQMMGDKDLGGDEMAPDMGGDLEDVGDEDLGGDVPMDDEPEQVAGREKRDVELDLSGL